MNQCTFIYSRRQACFVRGSRCTNVASHFNHDLCEVHRRTEINQFGRANEVLEELSQGPSSSKDNFPRIYTPEEERIWVTEARRRTSPEANIRRSCLVCGIIYKKTDLRIIETAELVRYGDLLTSSGCYGEIPEYMFQYDSHSELNGMVIDPNGFVKESDGFMNGGGAYICGICWDHVEKNKLPSLALANGLWTGAGVLFALVGGPITWLEEKALARVHVSVQVMKCRLLPQWRVDKFYPQRKLRGNIITFPMDPTAVLQRLPIAPTILRDLVKVVFVTKQNISKADLCKLKFCFVRRRILETVLKWLVANNPLYSDVELDLVSLALYPEEGVVSDILDSVVFCNKVKNDIMGHSRYDKSDEGEGICDIINSKLNV